MVPPLPPLLLLLVLVLGVVIQRRRRQQHHLLVVVVVVVRMRSVTQMALEPPLRQRLVVVVCGSPRPMRGGSTWSMNAYTVRVLVIADVCSR